MDNVGGRANRGRRHAVARRRDGLRSGAVQVEPGPRGGDGPECAGRGLDRSERLGNAGTLRDRRRAADCPRPGGAQDGWPVGDAGAEPHAGISRGQRHPAHVNPASRSAEGRRRGADAGRDCQEPLVRLLGCAAGDEAGPRDHRAAAPRIGHQARELVVSHHVMQREDRRRGARGDVPGAVDGHLLRRSAIHGVPRHEPSSHGCAGKNQ